jgi:hypothetical protein
MPHIRQATIDDCIRMAPYLREADKAEIKAHSGQEPLACLTEAFEDSDYTFCIEHNGEPIAIYGGVSVTKAVGCPWMLGTDGIKHHWIWFLRHSEEIVWSVHQHYEVLYNVVDIRNQVHIRWLKWCGFEFRDIHPEFGVEKRPFQEFVRYRNV